MELGFNADPRCAGSEMCHLVMEVGPRGYERRRVAFGHGGSPVREVRGQSIREACRQSGAGAAGQGVGGSFQRPVEVVKGSLQPDTCTHLGLQLHNLLCSHFTRNVLVGL